MEALNTGSAAAALAASSSLQTSASESGASAAASSSSSSSSAAAASNTSSSSTVGPLPSSDANASRIVSHNAALGRDASALFQANRHRECLDVLHRLIHNDPENPKVIHNIAVAQYFQDGCSDPQKLLDTLSRVKKKIEDLSKSVGEQMDGNVTSTTENTTAYLEDYDTSIPTFNTSVILYHLHQFAAALSVLEPLYHNIEPIDEPAALHICVLMLDIALASCQFRKACDVLQYMEKVFGLGFLVTNPDTSSNVAAHSTMLSSTLDSASNSVNANSTLNNASSNVIPEASLTRSSSEEVLDDEVLSLGLDMEGPNSGKPVAPLSMLSNAIRGSSDRPPSAPPRDSNVKILLHLNKVRLFLCTRNIRAAKREIKLAMNLAQGSDLLKALMLKAQLEYSRGNHRKAVKLLMTCSSKEPGMRYIILNNLGCIHHYLRKDNTSYLYFVRALQSCTSISTEKPLKLSTYSQNRSLSILYNCGLLQLKAGNPVLAAKCFQESGILYHRQPLFWHRLAECCILALEKGLLEDSVYDNSLKKDELRVSSAGAGKWRTLILPSGSLNPSPVNSGMGLKLDSEGSSSATDNSAPNAFEYFTPGKPKKLSLVFARQCLQNALHLLSRSMATSGKSALEMADKKTEDEVSEEMKNLSIQGVKKTSTSNGNNKEGKASNSNSLESSITCYEEEQNKHNLALMQHILADLAFVELCLNNPLRALKSARRLLQMLDCTKPFRFLARVYAAEALCMLNRPKEASAELSTCMTENSSLETPASGGDDEGQQWKSGENSEASGEGDDGVSPGAGNTSNLSEALNISSLTGTRARASLFVNLAMVHVMLGDINQAQHFAMQAVSITPANPFAVLSVVYVNLEQGKTQEAVTLLKHCRHLNVVNSRLG